MPLFKRTQRALLERTPAGVGWWSALLLAALLGLWSATGSPASAADAPALTGVSPSTAPFTGGTAVTLTGTGFVVGAGVTFNGAAATNVVVASSTQITADLPLGVEGPAIIEVTNPDTQSGTLSGAFSYLGLPPTITGVAPPSGSSLGGTEVTITGTDFVSGATVTFGGIAATSLTFDAATQLRATTPAHGVAVVDVVVTNPDAQMDTAVGAYGYVAAPAPTVSAVAPTAGTTGGGSTVTLTGTGFGGGATVTFGGAAASNVVVVSATQLTAKTPVHAAGSVDVVVRNPDTQTGTLVAGYVYVASPAPTITAVMPAVGSKAGGATVTITGTGFLEGAAVAFGGSAAQSVVVVSATTISATAPAGTVGKVTISVTNTDLQVGSLANAFEYLDAPTLTAAEPATGSSAGGEVVPTLVELEVAVPT